MSNITEIDLDSAIDWQQLVEELVSTFYHFRDVTYNVFEAEYKNHSKVLYDVFERDMLTCLNYISSVERFFQDLDEVINSKRYISDLEYSFRSENSNFVIIFNDINYEREKVVFTSLESLYLYSFIQALNILLVKLKQLTDYLLEASTKPESVSPEILLTDILSFSNYAKKCFNYILSFNNIDNYNSLYGITSLTAASLNVLVSYSTFNYKPKRFDYTSTTLAKIRADLFVIFLNKILHIVDRGIVNQNHQIILNDSSILSNDRENIRELSSALGFLRPIDIYMFEETVNIAFDKESLPYLINNKSLKEGVNLEINISDRDVSMSKVGYLLHALGSAFDLIPEIKITLKDVKIGSININSEIKSDGEEEDPSKDLNLFFNGLKEKVETGEATSLDNIESEIVRESSLIQVRKDDIINRIAENEKSLYTPETLLLSPKERAEEMEQMEFELKKLMLEEQRLKNDSLKIQNFKGLIDLTSTGVKAFDNISMTINGKEFIKYSSSAEERVNSLLNRPKP